MAGDEFSRIQERPVRILPAAAAVRLDEGRIALLLGVVRRAGQGRKEHEVDLVLVRPRRALDLLEHRAVDPAGHLRVVAQQEGLAGVARQRRHLAPDGAGGVERADHFHRADRIALGLTLGRDQDGVQELLAVELLLNSILVATQGKPERNTIRTMEMVGSLYPAGAVWCEVTPLPGNARQALLLRNNSQVAGWINGAVLQKIKSAPGSDEDKIDLMFLSALSRTANESEKKRYATFIKAHSGSGWEDAYWTLLNTTEFVTRH